MSYNVEREYYPKEGASKGLAGAALGTGIGGAATGIPALIMSIISLVQEGRRDRAREVCNNNGISWEAICMMMNQQNQNYSGCSENTPTTRYDI